MEKLTPDSLVHADCARDIVYVATNLLAQVRDFVNEGNLGRQESICRVLGQLRSFERRNDKRRFDQIKRTVEVLHDSDGFFVATPNYDAIGTHEVVNRRAFSKKFRVGNYAEVRTRFLSLTNQLANKLSGPNRHCRFSDDDLVAIHVVGS